MTETAKNSLKLARAALVKDNIEEATMHYHAVLQACPDELEAKWFSLYDAVVKAADSDIRNNKDDIITNYNDLSKLFQPFLSYIAALQEGEEKQCLAQMLVKVFLPLRDVLVNTLWNLPLYNPEITTIAEEVVEFMDALESGIDKDAVAEQILELFGDGKPYCLWAADIWKEKIASRFKSSPYRNFQDRGKELWFDQLAKRIQKYDPSYTLPKFKQAGCVSTDPAAANVKPGE